MKWMLVLLLILGEKSFSQNSIGLDNIYERIMYYQLPNGGWPKQYTDGTAVNYNKTIDGSVIDKISNNNLSATLDNHATTKEIQILAEENLIHPNESYQNSILKGVNYVLNAQMKNGGFPQFYPDKSGYRGFITFNDNAMINALSLLREIAQGDKKYLFLPEKIKEKARIAVENGVKIILKLQVKTDNKLTIWAAQYHNTSLKPVQARKFEPIALSASESVGIVRFLMQEIPTPEIISAVESAVRWFDKNKIVGYRFVFERDNKGNSKRQLVQDEKGILWSRFYEIGTDKPIFGDRDNLVHYNFNEISEERKNGYAWYGEWAQALLLGIYPKWHQSLTKENK